uniref:Cytosol aminopeptidase domain-containing protein n=1 Tax=Ditylenchus dipsaci TaxID=166011 RepID=A0A915DG36_9BILA
MIRITREIHKMLTISSSISAQNSVQNNHQVVLIGRNKLLKALAGSNDLNAKLGVDSALLKAAIDQLPNGAGGSVPLYLNMAKIIAVPDDASRHNTPSNAYSIFKSLQNLPIASGVKSLSVVLYAEYAHVFASVAAISKCFPVYSRKTADKTVLERISVEVVVTDQKELNDADVKLLQALSESIQLCGKLVDTPANELTTEAFVAETITLVENLGLKIQQTIIRGEDLLKQGFGGIYHLHSYFSQAILCFSGQSIVFDTGGMQIKTKTGMPTMKIDMGGAAACFAAFLALVKAGFQENLHCLLCIAENSISPVANKPDDIITLLSGKTVEITNTDAEGRLVLADGVFYAKTKLKADTIIDMATLTGAQSWATGKVHAAILTNNEETEVECIKAGKKSGDLVHALPYAPDLHFNDLKSTIADMKNSNFGDKEGPPSAIAGLFIGKQIDFPMMSTGFMSTLQLRLGMANEELALELHCWYLCWPNTRYFAMKSSSTKEKRVVMFVEGVQAQPNLAISHKWKDTLRRIDKDFHAGKTDFKDLILPVDAFSNPPLYDFLKVMEPGIKVEVRIFDYDHIFKETNKQIYWIATLQKICGYYLLLRYVGMEQEGDEAYDFWVNIGSAEVKNVGHCANNPNCELIPPNEIRKRQADWSKYMLCKLHAAKTLTAKWPEQQRLAITSGKFRVGHRLELLDRLNSTVVRPAHVICQLGRRVHIQVNKDDLPSKHECEEGDVQVTQGIWLDESSCLLFPVGWATRNAYGLLANKKYRNHCEAIVSALDKGEKPSYEPNDVTLDYFNNWNENTENDNSVHWKAGMKFECLDPLNSSFLELRVATCLGLLGNDGYLKIGFDGPDMEEETVPLHCTSPLLFPVGYGVKYNISVRGPSETTSDFCWNDYLRQSQSTAAPPVLFDPVPPPEYMEKYKVNSKLEATDLCEPNLICPSTIIDVKGRLLRVHFDGWEEDFDQLFDYRSSDIFPVGWCDLYGYKLEPPKIAAEPVPKKKKK